MPSWIRLTPPSELLRVTHTFLPVRIVGQAHKLCARCPKHSRMWLSPYPLGERETLPCPGVTPCATIRKWWDTCKGLLIDLTNNNHFVQNGHMMWTWLLHSKAVSRPNLCWCKVWPKIWPLLIPLFVGCNNSLSLGEGVTYCIDVLPTETSPVTTICKYSFSAGNVNSCEIMFFRRGMCPKQSQLPKTPNPTHHPLGSRGWQRCMIHSPFLFHRFSREYQRPNSCNQRYRHI